MNDLQQRLDGELGAEAQEEAWREFIGVVVRFAFSGLRVFGGGGIQTFGRDIGR